MVARERAASGGSDWENRRLRRGRWLRWLVLAPLVATGLTGLAIGAGVIVGGKFDSVFGLLGVKDFFELIQAAVDASLLGIRPFPIPIEAKLLVIWGFLYLLAGWRMRGLGLRLHDRFFPLYNGEFFRPIGPPGAGTSGSSALPWAEGTELDRIFRSLSARLNDPAERGTDLLPWYRPFGRIGPPLPFDHLLVLGRPGAGKSRMARHLARQLGRRDVLGDGGRGKPGNPSAARALSRGDNRRRFWWFLARRHGDPWDSGEIVGPVPDAFADWRPARPTLLWADDPVPGEIAKWVEKLREYSPRYRFPTRLVIANQTELASLPAPFRYTDPELLRGATYFSARDIARLARLTNLSPFDDARAETVHDVTEGNPLLVELAFEFLRLGRPLSEMTRDALVDQRVDRIVATLERAHPAFALIDAKKALALATLARPDCPIQVAIEAFPASALDRTALEAGFVSERKRGLDLSAVLPAIRPEMIGDAFIRRVASLQAPAAGEIAAAAFSFSPERWLRALARLGRSGDRVADALCALPEGLGAADEDFLIRVAQTLIRLGLHDWREPAEIAETVDRLLRTLDPAPRRNAATALLDWHERSVAEDDEARRESAERWARDLADGMTTAEAFAAQERDSLDPAFHRFIHGRGIAVIAPMLALHHFADGAEPAGISAAGPSPLDFVIAWSRHFVGRATFRTTVDAISRWVAPLLEAATGRFGSDDDFLQALNECRRKIVGSSGPVNSAVLAGLADRARAVPTDRARYFAKLMDVWLAFDDPAASREAAAAAEAMAGQLRRGDDGRDIQWGRAYTARCLAFPLMADADACRDAVAVVEAIAGQGRYADDYDMQLERVLARSIFAFSVKDNSASLHEAVAAVGAIAGQQRYSDDRDMQYERARAERVRAFALRNEPAACRAAVGAIEAIARQPAYADDRDMQYECVLARGYLAFGLTGDPVACRDAAESLEAIAGEPRFAGDRDMQLERTIAYRHRAFSLSDEPVDCREAVGAVEAIAGQPLYAGDSGMLLTRAMAQRFLAYSLRNYPGAFAETLRAIEAIVAIADPTSPDYGEIADELREARSFRA